MSHERIYTQIHPWTIERLLNHGDDARLTGSRGSIQDDDLPWFRQLLHVSPPAPERALLRNDYAPYTESASRRGAAITTAVDSRIVRHVPPHTPGRFDAQVAKPRSRIVRQFSHRTVIHCRSEPWARAQRPSDRRRADTSKRSASGSLASLCSMSLSSASTRSRPRAVRTAWRAVLPPSAGRG